MSEIDDAGVVAMQGPLLRLGPQPGKSLAISVILSLCPSASYITLNTCQYTIRE